MPRFRQDVSSPLLKWPGGKSAELSLISSLMPRSFDRYLEPFVGGGAVFWSLKGDHRAYLNDANLDLMNFYAAIAEPESKLVSILRAWEAWWRLIELAVVELGCDWLQTWERMGASNVTDEFSNLSGAVTRQCLPSLLTETYPSLGGLFVEHVKTGVPKKLLRMRKVEMQRAVQLPDGDVIANIEGAFKAAAYTAVRETYNYERKTDGSGAPRAALFFIMREYAYAAMFRFNSRGAFNVPYGGISYNRKDLRSKIDKLAAGEMAAARLSDAHLSCADFEEAFDRFAASKNDFIFLDPPYDSDFSDYGQSAFGLQDHKRLAYRLSETSAKFLLVIKSTPAILDLYPADQFTIMAKNKKYMWTIKERNDRDAVHLYVTNFEGDVSPIL